MSPNKKIVLAFFVKIIAFFVIVNILFIILNLSEKRKKKNAAANDVIMKKLNKELADKESLIGKTLQKAQEEDSQPGLSFSDQVNLASKLGYTSFIVIEGRPFYLYAEIYGDRTAHKEHKKVRVILFFSGEKHELFEGDMKRYLETE